MSYELLKALHIIFVVTWFAGLFYIVRLFIYHVESGSKPENERVILQRQFLIMEKRLWYGITWPSCILTIIFGGSLLSEWLPLSDNPWLLTKLGFVFLLFLYHLSCGHIYKKLLHGKLPATSFQLRLWNEVATLFLISIVFLVVLKSVLHMGYGVLGLFGIMLCLGFAVRVYQKIRKKA